MIGILDYGAGNLKSVFHVFEAVGAPVELCETPANLKKYARLVLPGVGAFAWCFEKLLKGGWVEPLSERVLGEKVPVLGICVGMQLMADWGHEGGGHRGLGWIAGEVAALQTDDPSLKIPHIGWNNVTQNHAHPLLAGVADKSDFYFVHSYAFRANDPSAVLATCDYGGTFSAVVAKDNVLGVQFHPEKSQSMGIQLVKNFSSWDPQC